MTVAAPRIRTRRNEANGTWDVQSQNIPGGKWRMIGRVQGPGANDGSWDATHYGRVVGFGAFRTKREAVGAIVQADSNVINRLRSW